MRKNFNLKYFIIFIFLAILFFINTRTVFAGKARPSGGSSEDERTTIYTPAEDLQRTGSNFCKIYLTSTPKEYGGQFTLGWKADIFSNTGDFYSDTGKETATGKVAFTSFNNVIAYPYIVIFGEHWKASNGEDIIKCSTGYLYLYVDEYKVKESASIWAGYANDDNIENCYLPLYYQTSRSGGESKGEALFGIEAFMTYLPLSNIMGEGGYYSQNCTSEGEAEAVMLKITGDGTQDLNGWKCWEEGNFLIGSLDNLKSFENSDKWLLMFAIGAMGENTYNRVGKDYIDTGHKEYKVDFSTIDDGFNRLKNGRQGKEGLGSEFDKIITGYRRINKSSEPNPSTGQSGVYYGFKDNFQENGIDEMFPVSPKTVAGFTATKDKVSRRYTDTVSCHKLLNGESILNQANNILFSGGSYNIIDKERVRLTPSKFAQAYTEILGAAEVAGSDSRFINIDGGHFLSRYSWGATVGSIAACQDTWFPKDYFYPGLVDKSPSVIIREKLPGIGISGLKRNVKTKNFGSYATDEWDSLTDDEKVTNTIIFLETYPWYVPLIAEKSKIGKVYKLGSGANTVVNLNKLGADKKTFKDWKKCIIEMGDYIVNHSLTAIFPSTGWSSQSAFSDGSRYAVQTYPIFIALTPRTYTAEDLLISNSYGDATNTANLGGMAGTIHDATARNTIDWGGDPDLGSLTYQGLNVGSVMKKSEDGGYGNPAWDKKNRA